MFPVGGGGAFACHRLSFSADSVLCGRIKPSGIAVFLSLFLSFSEEKLREENFKRKWPSGEAVGSERLSRNWLCKGFFFFLPLPPSFCLPSCKLTLRCKFPHYRSAAAGVKTSATLTTEGETSGESLSQGASDCLREALPIPKHDTGMRRTITVQPSCNTFFFPQEV